MSEYQSQARPEFVRRSPPASRSRRDTCSYHLPGGAVALCHTRTASAALGAIGKRRRCGAFRDSDNPTRIKGICYAVAERIIMRGSPVAERILFHLRRDQWMTRKDIAQVLGRKYGMGPTIVTGKQIGRAHV